MSLRECQCRSPDPFQTRHRTRLGDTTLSYRQMRLVLEHMHRIKSPPHEISLGAALGASQWQSPSWGCTCRAMSPQAGHSQGGSCSDPNCREQHRMDPPSSPTLKQAPSTRQNSENTPGKRLYSHQHLNHSVLLKAVRSHGIHLYWNCTLPTSCSLLYYSDTSHNTMYTGMIAHTS